MAYDCGKTKEMKTTNVVVSLLFLKIFLEKLNGKAEELFSSLI